MSILCADTCSLRVTIFVTALEARADDVKMNFVQKAPEKKSNHGAKFPKTPYSDSESENHYT